MSFASYMAVPDEGPGFQVDIATRDVLTWEKSNGQNRTMRHMATEYRIQDGYHLVWIAARRQGLIGKDVSLQQFEEAYDIEDVPEDKDPTQPEASSGS